ncbi:amino acid adenylation domain-containing protein [Gordonia sp. ABSL1-1]|uniref:non-ribosomal peptide synthetase n=1 Tax=Gordonia sp. ABSL1-1 TaxID=3053923 RepID=UPI0025747CD4|nr:non-ribosomal peptide synthetase [Gordonia sp. ABSL1-1]MDL9937935.1 amino acid adenylation domain-containing protein [Gordonia sp. ABSL1-1]
MAVAEFRAETPGEPGESPEVLPLTSAQRGMWFAERLSGDYSVNIAQYVDIRHEPDGLDLALLERCCVEVGKLVESPFVRLDERDGVPVQYVDLDFDQNVDFLDFRAEADPVVAAMAWMQAEYRRPVDLLNDQFIVIAFLRIADDRTFWYNRAHHIIIDGYAALSIMRRTVDRYNALRQGETPLDKAPASMAEIIAYEDDYQTSSRRAADREHWLQRVSDLPERVTLSNSAAAAPLSFDNVVVGDELPSRLQRRLEDLAAELNSSVAVVLTATFGAFLSRMTGSDDIVMSLPVTGRATAKIKAAGGMVSNVLPIRLREVSTQTARDLIRAAQLELTGALRHQRYRSDDIRRDAGLDAGSFSFGPTINMVFFDDQVAIADTTMEYRILTSGILEDLLINLYQSSPGAPLVVDLHGNPNLYTSAQMASHHRHFLAFLGRFVADVDARIADYELILPGEGTALVRDGRGERQDWPLTGRHLLDDFVGQARRNPTAVAIRTDARSWTYGELDRLRNQLAHQLVADGVAAGDRVVVALERGFAQVCAIYAVLGAGAAHVPLDPAQPDERRWHILDSARPALVIDDDYLAGIGFDEATGVAGRSDEPVEGLPTADLAAYVIFTSGSTGKPKGVEVATAAVINRLAWMQRNYPLRQTDSVLYKTPFTFDVSVWELLWPLQIGATMVIARPGGHRDPDYLAHVIDDAAVSVAHFVPSMLHTYVDVVQAARGPRVFGDSVRLLFTSGEALGRQLADRVLETSSTQLVNLYGPTEAAVDITEHVVDRRETAVPIGRPVANSDVYVLDSALRPVPRGVAGELYLAGCQLAVGYVGRADLTAARFVADPFVGRTPRRMYRTGDLVRWNESAELEYLGRSDFQVKIRGQRIELGEIESVLAEMPGVEGAVVVARTDLSTAPMLVAYLTVGATGAGRADAIDWCRRRLPSHMVPAAVVILDQFPVNNSGKLDRVALPTPVVTRNEETPYLAPASPVEVEVVALVEELLGIERIGLRDNIFALGADSLVAARLVSRLRSAVGLEVGLSDVFESHDIAGLIASARQLDDAAQLPPLAPVVRPDRIPLSYPQNRLWFINRLDPASGAYNIPGAVALRAEVNVEALRAAVADVIARHEPLRTTFPDLDGETEQHIHSVGEAADAGLFEVVDTAPDRVHALIAEISAVGFDLATQYPVRVRLLRSVSVDGAPAHVLVLVMHHIVGDGASLGPLITDVLTAYAARVHGTEPAWTPLPVQYADYTMWQRVRLGTDSDPESLGSRQLAFWRSELAGMPELVGLPNDRPRPTVATGSGGHVDIWADAELVARLRAVAAESGVTMFAILHASLAILLSRLSGSGDIAIGTAVAGRDEPELTDLIGMFVNTVVLRTRVRPDETVADLLGAVHHTRAQALSNADIPFEQVVTAVGARRSLAHSPLFQVELVLQHDNVLQLLGEGSELEFIDARTPFAKYDLSVSAIEYGDAGPYSDKMSISLSYATDLFDRGSVERLAGYFHEILDMVSQLTGRTGEVLVDDMFGFHAAEVDTVADWSAGPAVAVDARLLGDLVDLDAQVPNDVALVFADETLTYADFAAKVNALARELISMGVGPEVAVGVCQSRSLEMLIAIHAVIVAGGQYVPIDVDTPLDRARYMVDTAAVSVVLVGPVGPAPVILELGDRVRSVSVDRHRFSTRATGPVADAERRTALRPAHPAYTLFTSGSTGRPKAVTISHAAIVNRLAWMQDAHDLTAQDVVLQKTPITFDVSVWELFWPFMVGARLVVAEPGRHGEPDYLGGVIDRHAVTTVHFVPSMLSAFLDVLGPGRLAELTSLRRMFTSGEALAPATAQATVAAMPATALHNLYGPTEAAVDVTDHQVVAGDALVPIGRPIWNTGTYVLDARLRPVPVGVPGELYLGGVQLARGYAARGPLTAERFVASPFGAAGGRLYRTGDLVRWTRHGELEYLGRNDFQVKLRGQRLELGEIESVIASAPGVVHVAATVASLAGGEQVVAYVAPETVILDEVKAVVAERLPEYMRPTVWMLLERMPLNSAGKVDRTSLPRPQVAEAEYVAPRSETERVVAAVFAGVLGAERVSVLDSFFDLGGNSLSATKVAARLSAELDREIPVTAIFDAPTVQAMAELAGALDVSNRRPPLRVADERDRAPLSSVQRGMWLINRADPDSSAYNVAMAMRLSGRVNRVALGRAIDDIVERHESLRTRYPMLGGEPSQVVLDAAQALELIERRIIDVGGGGADIEATIADITGRGFDVTAQPPLRVALLALAPDDHILVLVVHHIAADGASMSPLAADMIAAYTARAGGQTPDWAPLPIQYLDFSVWQHQWLADEGESSRQLDYWTDRLAGAPARLELPADRPRPRTPSFAGDEVTFEIEPELISRLEGVARQNNATLFMVMHAAFAILLSRLSSTRDIVIGTPFAGRGQPELDGVVGMFVNTLALRTRLHDEEKFAELLERLRDDDLADMANADVAFDTIAASVVSTQPVSYNPVFQVMFAFQNFDFPSLELADLTITPVSEQLTAAKVDLQLTLFPTAPDPSPRNEADPMKGQLIFATDLFTRRTVELYGERYVRVLEEVSENPQVLVGDISIITSEEDGALADADADALMSLPDLVAMAARSEPEATAVSRGGAQVTFGAVWSITEAMAAALPDLDSALTTALMSLIPEVSGAPPEAFGEVLQVLRDNAHAIATSGAKA